MESTTMNIHNDESACGPSKPRTFQKTLAKLTNYATRFLLKISFAERVLRGKKKSSPSVTPLPTRCRLHSMMDSDEENQQRQLPLKGHAIRYSLESGSHRGERPVDKSVSSESIDSLYSQSNSSQTLYSSTSSLLSPVPEPELKPRRRVRFKLSQDDFLPEDTHGNTPPLPHSGHVRRLQFHSLFAGLYPYSARIIYDVKYLPSSWIILDRATKLPIPIHLLHEPATDPPIPVTGRLVLNSDMFPWPVMVGPSNAACVSVQSIYGVGFYASFSCPPQPRRRNAVITNFDLLCALHRMLQVNVTNEEWSSLGDWSAVKRGIAEAYERRCNRIGYGWEAGVKRIDWLGTRTTLIGVEVSAGEETGRLIFGRY